MNETEKLIGLLKQYLKASGITYAMLGNAVGMSEANVKRIFSQKTFTLKRFEEFCHAAGTSIETLSSTLKISQQEDFYEYTEKQEKILVKNLLCLSIFDLLINGESPSAIKKKYNVSSQQLSKSLNVLDEIELIQRLPKDKIKFLTSKNIKWKKNGPLKNYLMSKAKDEFLNGNFDASEALLSFSIIKLSKTSAIELLRDISSLRSKYVEISSIEAKFKIPSQSLGVILATRPWNFSAIQLESSECNN